MAETEINSNKNSLKKLFSTQWVTGNLNFFLFLSFLTVLYIANGHLADRFIRNSSKAQNEIKELEYQYKTLKSEVMYKSQEEQVLKAAEPLGLKISKDQPQRLQSEKTNIK